jgi:hypothetical protein
MERVRQIMLAAKTAGPQPSAEAANAGGGDTATEYDTTEQPVSTGPLTETFYDVDTLPRFQKRMYRNDI